jgi:isopenicillin-N epimerase
LILKQVKLSGYSKETTLPIPALAAHFLVRPDIAFLNHGSFGACPREVFEAYQRWQRELETQPVEFLGRRLTGLLAEARAVLAAYVGTDANNLVFVPNATFGVNVVARSLKLQPGDEVLATNHEYGAAERAWRFVCQTQEARYLAQAIPLPVHEPEEIMEHLWAGVTERTRVIFISHITSPTALIFPVKEICQRARAAGIFTVIDGAHAPGQIELDLDELGADFYTGNCHKWLCAPKGSGFLYARPEHQALLEPLVVSWGWESLTPGPSPFIDYFDWLGTDDPAAYLAVPAAIAFQQKYAWPHVRAACRQLAQEARTQIQGLTGLPQLYPDTETWWGQMTAIPLPPCNPQEIGRRLWEEFQVETPVFEWNGHFIIRVSIQAYNRPADVDRLLRGLKQLLP